MSGGAGRLGTERLGPHPVLVVLILHEYLLEVMMILFSMFLAILDKLLNSTSEVFPTPL